MTPKTTTIALRNRKGVVKNYELRHAERLLGLGAHCGWSLTEDSPYTYDPTLGLRLRPRKQNNKPTENGTTKRQA